MSRKRKILFISTMPPSHSAGLGQDIINALNQADFDVDMIIKYPYRNQPENVKNALPFPYKDWVRDKIRKNKISKALKKLIKRLIHYTDEQELARNTHSSFYYKDEAHPEVNPETILSKIQGSYDAVITLFWEKFITTETLRKVYDKLKCPILIYSVDMAPITGGCYYFGKCRRMFKGCGICMALGSNDPNDPSRSNFKIKRKNYAEMNVYFLANTWMNEFASRTNLFNPEHIQYQSIVLNKDKFRPAQSPAGLFSFGAKKKFVILFTSSRNIQRKGYIYAEQLIAQLYDRLTPEERESVQLLTIGGELSDRNKKALGFDIKELGFVKEAELIKAYQTASIFISPSIDDAGPSMVNQAMMCGTPVAAFNIGTAIDLISHAKNGFVAPLTDVKPLADGIVSMIRNPEMQKEMRIQARSAALIHNSYETFSNKIRTLIDIDPR